MRYLAVAASAMVGLTFLVASVSKLVGRGALREFVSSVRDLGVLPARAVPPVAVLVVVAELGAWMLIAVPLAATAVAGLVLAIGVLVAVTAGVGSALRRGAQASCRCFGPSGAPLGLRHVVRNTALVCVAAVGVVAWDRAGHAPAGGVAVAVAAGLLLGGVVTVLDDLIDLFRPVSRGTRHA
jgi:methylamine utilization protein MauE